MISTDKLYIDSLIFKSKSHVKSTKMDLEYKWTCFYYQSGHIKYFPLLFIVEDEYLRVS